MAKMNKKQIKIFEIVWYTITGLVMIWGLTYVVLGLVAHFIPDPNNGLKDFNSSFTKTFGLNLLYWGLIIFAIGAIAMVIALLNVAKEKDRDFEKEQRRKARIYMESAINHELNQEENK